MMMRLLSTLAFAALSTAAHAADLAPTEAPFVAGIADPAFDWTGLYVGAHGGYFWGDTDVSLAEVVGPIFTLDIANGVFPRSIGSDEDGVLFGAHAGYNFQSGLFVGGFEADISRLDQDSQAVQSVVDPGPVFPGALVTSTFGTEIPWIGTARARAGAALDRTLLYATGGLAFGEVKSSVSVDIPAVGYAPPAWTNNDVEFGWTLGGGIELALTDSLIARLEYLHYDLEDRTIRASDAAAFPGQFIDYSFDNSGDVVRAGLSFKF